MSLDDQTELVHSEMLPDGKVEVYIEKPDEKNCFHRASCFMSGYEWKAVRGFSDGEIANYQEIIESTAYLLVDVARKGGFEHAAGRTKASR